MMMEYENAAPPLMLENISNATNLRKCIYCSNLIIINNGMEIANHYLMAESWFLN